jgi:hypothetical protein
MEQIITLPAGIDGFAEDKDEARNIRINDLLPALDRGESVVIDFGNIRYATQSYVHALIGEALRKHGEPVLDLIEFKNCSPQLRSLVELVVDYSLGGFPLAH